MALLRDAHDERGQTIVLVTHDARVAARADRVIAMRDGAVASETRLDGGGDFRAVARLMQLEVWTMIAACAARSRGPTWRAAAARRR